MVQVTESARDSSPMKSKHPDPDMFSNLLLELKELNQSGGGVAPPKQEIKVQYSFRVVLRFSQEKSEYVF